MMRRNRKIPLGYLTLKSLKLYNKTCPRLFPIAAYSLPAEKSIEVTCPNGVFDVGQFANAVNEGR